MGMRQKLSVQVASMSVVALLGCFCIGAHVAFADDVAVLPTEKSETVTVTTDATGAVSKVKVTDTLKNASAADQLLDMTELVDVKGDDDATYVAQGDGILWQADGKEVTYSGTIAKELPITVRVTYTLDGNQVSPEELKGKSGEVRIRYDFDNNSVFAGKLNGADVEMRVPFTCMTALMLDGDVFSNVKVTNGKVIDDGNDSIVMGYAMPGLKQSLGTLADEADIPAYFEVTATAREFELKSSMTMVTAGLMSGLDVDGMGFNDLDDTSAGLREAMDSLKSGAGELTSGMGELTYGARQLNEGAVELASGADELSGGLYLFTYGNDGKSGLNGSVASADELIDGMAEVDDGLKQLADSNTGLPAAAAGLDAIAQAYPDEQTVQALTAVITSEKSGLDPATQKALVGLLQSTAEVKKVSAGVNEASAGLVKLSAGYGKLVEGARSLPEGMAQAVSAAKQLYGGSLELAEGTHQLSDATGQLAAGVSAAEEGTSQLEEGLDTFDKEGISKIVSTIDDDLAGLKKRLKILSGAADDYTNFAGKEPATPGTVKFVYEGSAIEI